MTGANVIHPHSVILSDDDRIHVLCQFYAAFSFPIFYPLNWLLRDGVWLTSPRRW